MCIFLNKLGDLILLEGGIMLSRHMPTQSSLYVRLVNHVVGCLAKLMLLLYGRLHNNNVLCICYC